ncbi:hypothetical protein ILUMI_01469 [Ignelater luminosus]|uniref:Uncharacterized protein n=1 Tax=Ignelater luminosus TaxID=2038154 RepID=A0A8K0DQN9_IGNLU|nr:hypothetical protein ILUMI_01469 [Ignelater luminosus]
MKGLRHFIFMDSQSLMENSFLNDNGEEVVVSQTQHQVRKIVSESKSSNDETPKPPSKTPSRTVRYDGKHVSFQVELAKSRIWGFGTVEETRWKGCNFETDAQLKKQGHQSSTARRCIIDTVQYFCSKWFDSRIQDLYFSRVPRKSGRPSEVSINAMYKDKQKTGPAAAIPIEDVRLDKIGHFFEFSEKKCSCKEPSYKGTPKV